MKFNKSKLIKLVSFLVVIYITFITVRYILKPTQYELEMIRAYAIKVAHPEMTIFEGFSEPPIPDREESEKTLLGLDVNKNGLRDDVEIWINRTQADPNIRNALRQLHFVYQKLMTVREDYEFKKIDADKVNLCFHEEAAARQCLDARVGDFDEYRKLYEHFNKNIQNRNKKNKAHYLQAADQLSDAIGITVGLSSIEVIKKNCIVHKEGKKR